MTALDGFSFIVFITSNDLRQLLSKGYSDLPKSAVIIRNRMINFSFIIRKKKKIDELKQLKNTG